jgi:hypothetical protein
VAPGLFDGGLIGSTCDLEGTLVPHLPPLGGGVGSIASGGGELLGEPCFIVLLAPSVLSSLGLLAVDLLGGEVALGVLLYILVTSLAMVAWVLGHRLHPFGCVLHGLVYEVILRLHMPKTSLLGVTSLYAGVDVLAVPTRHRGREN